MSAGRGAALGSASVPCWRSQCRSASSGRWLGSLAQHWARPVLSTGTPRKVKLALADLRLAQCERG